MTNFSSQRIRYYYRLAKPGIVYGNLFSASAGFLLASAGNVNLVEYIWLMVGFGLFMGSACVFNNILDLRIDKAMSRTKNRALPAGKIKAKDAFLFGCSLLIISCVIFSFTLNNLGKILGISAFIFYVFIYGLAKRNTIHSTLIGAIPGASPPLIAYVAVKGSLDLAAVSLFAVMFVWQLAHFYAIAIFRFDDYKKAKIPLISVKKGTSITKKLIVLSILIYILCLIWLFFAASLGAFYIFIMILISCYWLYYALINYHKTDILWSKKVFFVSLINLVVFSLAISISASFKFL